MGQFDFFFLKSQFSQNVHYLNSTCFVRMLHKYWLTDFQRSVTNTCQYMKLWRVYWFMIQSRSFWNLFHHVSNILFGLKSKWWNNFNFPALGFKMWNFFNFFPICYSLSFKALYMHTHYILRILYVTVKFNTVLKCINTSQLDD